MVTIANAVRANPPLAYMSERAWSAETCPRMNGSSKNEGKKSIVCTNNFFSGTGKTKAQSSPSRRPTFTGEITMRTNV